jgi:peptidoglycan/xylan/chitin deacetylase (PgdA/CDA1 family)
MKDRDVEHAAARGELAAKAVQCESGLLRSLPELDWHAASVSRRAVRRLGLAVRIPPAMQPRGVAADQAFWRAVRARSSPEQWRRLTWGYTALAYHRVSGECQPGRERYDVAPRRFRRGLLVLRWAGFRPLSPEELLAAHWEGETPLGRRFVVTLDDGYQDAAEAARDAGWARPHLYVPTDEVGSTPAWSAGRPLAGWPLLQDAERAGAVLGSHAAVHAPLDALPIQELQDQVRRSLEAVTAHSARALPALAYPHGRYDDQVRDQAVAAGYRLAWTTLPGRNGASTDPWALRRVSPKDWDGPLSVLWKAVTGTTLPRVWDRFNQRRWALLGRRARP